MVDPKSGGAGSLLLYVKLAALLAAGNFLAWLIPCGAGSIEALANSKEVATWAGVLVTAAALLLSWVLWWRQAEQTAAMQRQALMPHLTFRVRISRTSAPHIQIELVNDGLGPAIIRSFRGSVDNSPISGGAPEFAHRLTDHFQTLLDDRGWDSEFSSIDTGEWMPKGGRIELVNAKTTHPEKLRPLFARPTPQINIEINRFRIDVEYESVFAERIFETSPWKLEFTDPDIQDERTS